MQDKKWYTTYIFKKALQTVLYVVYGGHIYTHILFNFLKNEQ